MNTPSPLTPQGSLEEQKNKNRSRVKIAVFFVLGIHVVGLLALLALGGCKKEADATHETASTEATNETTPTFVEPTNNTVAGGAPTSGEASNNTAGPEAAAAVPGAAPIPEPPQPPVAPVSVPVPAAGGTEYQVVKGDSFALIAKKFHVSSKAIAAANPTVQPTKLKVGQKITIPAPTAPAPTAAVPTAATGAETAAAAPAGSGQSYSVKSGDTLTKIASQFHVSLKSLRSANSLKTDRIKVGQKLRIPAKGSAPAHTAGVVPPTAPPTLAPAVPPTPAEPATYTPAPGAMEAPAAR